MNTYAASVIVTAALTSLALALSYKEGSESNTAVRAAMTVMLLYVTVIPLFGVIKNFDADELFSLPTASESEYTSAIGEVAEDAFCSGIVLFVADEFSLEKDDISVMVTGFNKDEMTAEKISVTLRGRAAASADFRAVREKIEKNGLGKCEVKIEIG